MIKKESVRAEKRTVNAAENVMNAESIMQSRNLAGRFIAKGGKKEEMKHLFLAENAEELNNLQSLTEGFAPILNEYLDYLKMNFQVVELPRSIVWAGFETEVNSVSDLPLPAYTNDYRTVMNPQIEVWRRLYLKQTDAYTESESVKKVKQYYEKFNMHNVLQILGHEMAHHSDLFLDETYETEMWFEEGMAEYISRRYFLTDEEYAAEKETNRILAALYDEKFGRPKLNDFSRSAYGRDIVHIFYAYWRSFLAVDAAAEKYGGNALKVFESYRRWYDEGAKCSLENWLDNI